MTRLGQVLCGLAVLTIGFSVSLAADVEKPKTKTDGATSKPAKENKDAKNGLMGEYAMMAKEAGLDADQQAKLADIVAKNKAAAEAWEKDKGAKLADLKTQIKDARANNDKEKIKTLEEQIKVLAKELSDIQTKTMTEALALMKPDQLEKWEGFRLYRVMSREFSRAKLDDAQQDKVRQMALAAAKDMIKATDDKAKLAVREKLVEDISKTVLTDAQRDAMKAKPEEKKGDSASKPANPSEKPATGAPVTK